VIRTCKPYSIRALKTLYECFVSPGHSHIHAFARHRRVRGVSLARLPDSRADALASYLGDDYPLGKIRERLKCVICSCRKATITFLGPHQKGGNLHYLFEKEAR
jgi:hypothetical protein